MQRSRQIFTIFLASPSDVDVERGIAESAVEFVNKSIANRIGWHIDLHRWEDTPPSFGRPQASINPLVDECDLFIGLLWQWWGQPTGGYSSGFEEEFERAKARRRTSGNPEIWLMFKDFDQSKKNDPGEQLKKVIEFQESQIQLGEVRFAKVKDTEDWKERLQLWLPQRLLEFTSQHPEISHQRAIAPPTLNSAVTGLLEERSSLAAGFAIPPQLKATAAALGSAVAHESLGLFDKEGALSEFEVARLFLLCGTLISRRYTHQVFGPHEINLIYKHRNELNLAPDESLEILRSVVGGEKDVIPGWFWFRDVGKDEIYDLLFRLAIDDLSDNVRIGALDLLTLSRFEIPHEAWQLLPLRDGSWVGPSKRLQVPFGGRGRAHNRIPGNVGGKRRRFANHCGRK